MKTYRGTTARNVAVWTVVLGLSGAARIMAATDDQCRTVLLQALEARNPETRKQAVVALSLVAGQFLPQLTAMLADRDVDVRLATVMSLTEVKSPQVVAALRSALSDEVPEVSFAATKALWSIHEPIGKQALLSILAGDSQTSSNYFSKQRRDMLRLVRSPRGMLLFAMHQGIGFVPVPYLGVGVTSMQALISDVGVSGRAAAALMLATDRDPATLDALRDALKDSDWSVRAAAVHAIALRKDPRLKPDLASMLEDEHEGVRLRAAAACVRLTPPKQRAAAR